MIPDKDPHSVLVECTKPIAEYMSKYTDEEFVQMVDRGFEALEAEMYNTPSKDRGEQVMCKYLEGENCTHETSYLWKGFCPFEECEELCKSYEEKKEEGE